MFYSPSWMDTSTAGRADSGRREPSRYLVHLERNNMPRDRTSSEYGGSSEIPKGCKPTIQNADLIGSFELCAADVSALGIHTLTRHSREEDVGGRLGTEKLMFHQDVGFQDQDICTALPISLLG